MQAVAYIEEELAQDEILLDSELEVFASSMLEDEETGLVWDDLVQAGLLG
jgi:hypothetical protein